MKSEVKIESGDYQQIGLAIMDEVADRADSLEPGEKDKIPFHINYTCDGYYLTVSGYDSAWYEYEPGDDFTPDYGKILHRIVVESYEMTDADNNPVLCDFNSDML